MFSGLQSVMQAAIEGEDPRKTRNKKTMVEADEETDTVSKEVSGMMMQPHGSREVGPLADVVTNWLHEGKLVYKTVQSTKIKLMRGHLVTRDLPVAAEFQIFFVVTVHGTHQQDRSIVHVALNEATTESGIPSVVLKANSTQLVAEVRQGEAFLSIPGPETGVQLHVPTQVRFMVKKGVIAFEIDTWRSQVDAKNIVITTAMSDDQDALAVYLSGPTLRPAKATVNNFNYYAHLQNLLGDDAIAPAFKLPLKEQLLIEHSQREIKRNRKWAEFDTFFGVFLILNSITIGLQTESPADYWQVFEQIFLVIFIIELCARIFIISSHEHFCRIFQDAWLAFDAMVILISVADTWIWTDSNLPQFLSALRLLRLLKLAKLVRLVRTFRELALLMEGLIMSIETLAWSFLLLTMVIFSSSVLIVRIVKWDITQEEETKYQEWMSVPEVMWTIGQLATLDDWGTTLAWVGDNMSGPKRFIVEAALAGSIIICSLGIVNIIIGSMCQTSTVVAAKQHVLQNAENLRSQQEAASVLRNCFRNWGERPLFKSDKVITGDEIFEALASDASLQAAARTLGLGFGEFLSLCESFAENGEVEIDGLCEAIGSICMQEYSNRTKVDLLADDSLDVVRPLDALFFHFSLKDVQSCWQEIEHMTQRACTYTYDTLSTLYQRASHAHTLLRLGAEQPWVGLRAEPEPTKGEITVESLAKLVSTFSRNAASARLLMPLDILTGVLLTVNFVIQSIAAISYGRTGTRPWFISLIDLVLAFCFFIELILRYTTGCNLWYAFTWPANVSISQAKGLERKRFGWISSRMIFKLIPPLPPPEAVQVNVSGFIERENANGVYKNKGVVNGSPLFVHKTERGTLFFLYKNDKGTKWVIAEQIDVLPEQEMAIWLDDEDYSSPPIGMPSRPVHEYQDVVTIETSVRSSFWQLVAFAPHLLKDWGLFLDVVVIMFTLIDAIVFEIMRRAGDFALQNVGVSLLRSVRILRLFMVLRLLKLMPTLQNLFAGLVNVWRTLLWMVALLTLLLYVYCLYMVVLVGANTSDPDVKFFFSTVAGSILSGWQFATFDHWEPLARAIIREAPFHIWISVMLMIVVALGLVKMVVGIMCESAVSLQRKRNNEQADADAILFLRTMEEITELCRKKLDCTYLPQESIEMVFDIVMRPRSLQAIMDPALAAVATAQMREKAIRPDFVDLLKKYLKEARLTPELTRKIFDKMDPQHTGYLSVDLLMKGGLMMRKQGLNRISVFAMLLAIRDVRRLCTVLTEKQTKLQATMGSLLKDMACVIQRQRPHDDDFRHKSPREVQTMARTGKIPPDVRKALDDLASFPVHGTPQDLYYVSQLGDIQLLHGTGLVEISGDVLRGYGTEFRKVLAPGSVIVLESVKGKTKGMAAESGCAALVVVAVLDNLACRIRKSSRSPDITGQVAYTIVKMDRQLQAFVNVDGDISLTVEPPIEGLSPRTSQRMFEWNLESISGKKNAEWQERGAVWEEYIKLQNDIEALARCEVAKEVLWEWHLAARETKNRRRPASKQPASRGWFG